MPVYPITKSSRHLISRLELAASKLVWLSLVGTDKLNLHLSPISVRSCYTWNATTGLLHKELNSLDTKSRKTTSAEPLAFADWGS